MTAALELRQVSKIYGSGPTEVHALRSVDLVVNAGELVAIMGPSGSGKSTLLTIAGTLEEATSGEVLIGGSEVAKLSKNEQAKLRRRAIGYVFQDFNLLAGGRWAFGLYWRLPDSDHADALPLYVATPPLLERLGADSAATDSHEVFSVETEGDVQLFSSKANRVPVTDLVRLPDPGYSSLPSAFVSPELARDKGWEHVRAGWFIETGRALTSEQRTAARELAIAAGLTIETRDEQASLSTLRSGATAAGMLLALAVLAMTVGLIRSESAGDLRTLTATGASSRVRRNLTAATAGALALLGVLLGTAGAYLVLIGAYIGDLGDLSRIPFAHLTVIAAGVPLIAFVAGWLLAGREPPAIARAALE